MSLHQSVTGADHVQEGPAVPVTLVLYGDFQCPFSASGYQAADSLQQYFGATLRLVHRHFPLPHLDPQALQAAQLAAFAGDHGQFRTACAMLYHHQPLLGPDLFEALARWLGLSIDALHDVYERGAYLDCIERDIAAGRQSGVRGTPTFFINARRYRGDTGTDALHDAIEAACLHTSPTLRVPQSEYPPQPLLRQRQCKTP